MFNLFSGALAYIELGTMVPESGAEYPYLLAGFGPFVAFLTSWMNVLVIKPAAFSIISL